MHRLRTMFRNREIEAPHSRGNGPIQTPEEWAQVSKELDSKELETKKFKKLTKKLSEINEN